MSTLVIIVLFLSCLPIIYLLRRSTTSLPLSKKQQLPPGSLGIPIIGQTLAYLNAIRANWPEEWINHRTKKYGPISKLSLFGTPTILVAGPAANKFLFKNVETFVPQLPKPVAGILGMRNLVMLHGEEHRRVRGAVSQFLRPEVLKQYVGRMDEETRHHIKNNWTGRQNVKAQPLMRTFTFNVICALLFGVENGGVRDSLLKDLVSMIQGLWAPLLGLPLLNLNKSTRAATRIRKVLSGIIQERKLAMADTSKDLDDLITCLVGLRSEDGTEALTNDDVLDNLMVLLFAGYDTTSTLLTFVVRHLGNDPVVRARVTQEHEDIVKSKASSEDPLTWDDIAKMKYTWRVAMETLRMIPPVFGAFRKVLKDVEYNGYLIPEGWSVFWVANETHMDETIFQDPKKFDPTRFKNPLSIPPYSMVPFGAGPRICPGNEFARLETLVMIHHLVTKFEWKLSCEENVYTKFPMPSAAEELPIQLHPKK